MSRCWSHYTDEMRAEVVAYSHLTNDVEAAGRYGVSRRSVIRWRQASDVDSGYQPPPRTAGHGTRGMYTHGCRCAVCKRRNADYQRARRARLRETP